MTHVILHVGDQAPNFTLPSDLNEVVSLKDFHGKNVVLYFYPKDNTLGCTFEACRFRDNINLFTANDAVILGISRDKPEKHQRFKQKHTLPFTLLADVNGDVCEAYGVINKKSLLGNTFLGIKRSTFLIDRDGKIRAIWRRVNVFRHARQVLETLTTI